MQHGIGKLGKSTRRVGRAKPSWDRAIAAGVACYDRSTHLARILPVGPDEIADGTVAGRRRILVRLARALRPARILRFETFELEVRRERALVLSSSRSLRRLLSQGPNILGHADGLYNRQLAVSLWCRAHRALVRTPQCRRDRAAGS